MEMDKSGKFSIKSVYEHLTKNENGPAYKAIWNAKVPEKVKKIMWLVAQKAILMKDNMLKNIGKEILIATSVGQ
jgi:hypothetical protein